MKRITKLETSVPVIKPRKRVAAYARISMETELMSHSLSSQISYYNEKIQKNPDWFFVGVYSDNGISGRGTANREGFKQLISDCDAGNVDLILTKSISRFARNTVDLLQTVRHLKEIGVEVFFEREAISTFTTDGELLLTLLASFAQAESESISANVKWAVRKRFEDGIPNGHKAPYGYEWDGEVYRIVPEQGEVVRYIFERYLAGVPGYSIAKELKETGVTGQSGVPMCDSTIRDVISNISYTGTLILQKNYFTEEHVRKRNKGELPRYAVEEMYEPLISVEEYERAQSIRRSRAEEIPCAVPTRFSGLVKCGNCGCGISRRIAKGKRKWVCNTRERKGIKTCDSRPVSEKELEAAAEAVVGKAVNEEFRRRVLQIIVYGDRIEFRLRNGKVKSILRKYGGHKARNGFSGKLFCGECGEKMIRDTWKKRNKETTSRKHCWMCSTPRSACSLKRLPEEELRKAAAAILSTAEYEAAFVEKVRKAVVFNDSIHFEFKDGTVKKWQRELQRSRRP